MLIFIAPVFISVFYVAVASGRYVSEAQFIVRGVNSSQAGALSSLLRTFGLSRSNDDAFAIESYIASRDALDHLNSVLDITEMYNRPEADFLTRYSIWSNSGSFESLFRYYQNRIEIVRDFETGITTLRASAYRPEDSQKIVETLLSLGEARVNEMNERSRRDLLSVTERTVKEAELQVLESQLALTRFRLSELNVDMEQAAAGRVDLVTKLIQELANEEVKLRQLQENAPSSPAVTQQGHVVEALKLQIKLEQGKIAGSEGGLATQLGAYEPLVLKKSMAETAYQVAARALDQAREEARRKQIYLEPIVKPHRPDEPTEPRRVRLVFTTALLTFASFLMIYLLVSGSREHLNVH